jgi:ribosomal-protein-alanine N-acetyltransferase
MLTHCGSISIETDRLFLRQFKYSDDVDMLANWISDKNIQSMISEPTYSTKEEVKELLDKYITAYQNDDYYKFIIILPELLVMRD